MTLPKRIRGAAWKVCNAATSPSLLTPRVEIICQRHASEVRPKAMALMRSRNSGDS